MSGSHQSETEKFQLNSIEEAVEDIRQGRVIIVVDDEDRENEGDFICAAETITPEIINFMSKHGRGLICCPIDEKRADELNLPLMVNENTALHETAFTVSIDLIGHGCTTGISAHDRAKGIKALVDPKTNATDFARPGHIFPLRAKSGGVLRRTGHTEATIDLAEMAGFSKAGVLVEILNEDGSMARLPQLMQIAQNQGIKIISIKDLVAYRLEKERLVTRFDEKEITNSFGTWKLLGYRQNNSDDIHFALVMGNPEPGSPTLVRVHSESPLTDLLSIFIQTEDIIMRAMRQIKEEGKGVFLFMNHSDKFGSTQEMWDRAFKRDHVRPSKKNSAEQRDFGVGAQILKDIGVGKMHVLTNNPRRQVGIVGYGLEVVRQIQL